MRNSNLWIKRNSIFFLSFILLVSVTACDSSSGGGTGENKEPDDGVSDDESISVPDGYAVYGTVDNQAVQILEKEITSAEIGSNWQPPMIQNFVVTLSNQTVGLKLIIYSENQIYQTEQIYSLEGDNYGYVDISQPDQSSSQLSISSGRVLFTSLAQDEGDIVAGFFTITLKDGRGELSGRFNSPLTVLW